MDLQYLVPKIRHILTGPDVDLTTISAKRVRKQLIASGEKESLVRGDRKPEIDALIAQIYESVSAHGAAAVDGNFPASNGGKGAGGQANNVKSPIHKRKRSSSADPSFYEPPSSQPQPLVHKKSKQLNGASSSRNGSHLSDAELARQLSLELNGRSTRAGAAPTASAGPKVKAGSKKGKRSKPMIKSEDEDEDGDPSQKRKGAKGGFGKEYVLSDPLADVTGHGLLSRPQAVKKLWEYIKGNNLQNPDDKREILCDPKMKAVFHTDRLNMFKMNKILGEHLFEPGE